MLVKRYRDCLSCFVRLFLFWIAREIATRRVQGCVLTYDTQHHLDDLNRHAAKSFLSAAYLDASDIPPHIKVFGSDSYLEMEPLILALNREWQRHDITLVRVYLGGNASLWEPLAWRFVMN